MIDFPVTPKKKQELFNRMSQLGILESAIRETFVKSSGSGGQKVNKSSSAVAIKFKIINHEELNLDKKNEALLGAINTGKDVINWIEIKCSKSRSQGLNRYYARVILCEKLEMIQKTGKKYREIEKIKKNKIRKIKKNEVEPKA